MLCRIKIGIKSTLNQNDKHFGVIHNVNGGINILSYTLYDNSRNNTHILKILEDCQGKVELILKINSTVKK